MIIYLVMTVFFMKPDLLLEEPI